MQTIAKLLQNTVYTRYTLGVATLTHHSVSSLFLKAHVLSCFCFTRPYINSVYNVAYERIVKPVINAGLLT